MGSEMCIRDRRSFETFSTSNRPSKTRRFLSSLSTSAFQDSGFYNTALFSSTRVSFSALSVWRIEGGGWFCPPETLFKCVYTLRGIFIAVWREESEIKEGIHRSVYGERFPCLLRRSFASRKQIIIIKQRRRESHLVRFKREKRNKTHRKG